MFANSRDQKSGVGVKWGTPFAKDRVHGPRFDEKSHLFGAQKTESDTIQASRNLWVGNVSQHVSETALAEQFSRFGEIENITVYSARSYAFINFRKEEDAVIAKRSLQGLVLSGQALRIEFAKGDSHLSSSHHAEEHPRLRDDRRLGEVVGFSGLRDSRVPGPNSDPSSDKHKGDKDGEPSEVLWIRFPGYMKVDEMSLRKEFSPFGEIDNITTFPGRTYAFVQFRSVVAACRAKEALQGKLFSNPRVYICFSKSEFGPVEHGRNSVNGTLPFSHKVAINSGIGSKVVENLRQERNHGITHGALGMPSPSFNSNPERMHSGSSINLLGRANSMKTIGGGYDDIRATRLGSDLGATKEVSELSVNSPGIERSPFWHTNTPDKSRGGGSYFEDIWDSSTDDNMTSREVKRPRFGTAPGRDASEVPFLEQGRDLQRFYPPRSGAMNPGPEGYKFSQFPIGNDGDVGASHCSANIIADNARHSTRPSHQIDAPWNAPNNFESVVAAGIPPPLDSAKWDGHMSDIHHGPLNEEWKWQGTIAKGGTPVCRARCFPVGKVLDVTLPEFLNCTARTGLDMLAKHFYQAGSVGVVFFVPENDPDIIPYNEFMHYLGEKQRAAVAKLGEGTTLFLVPPSQFSEQVLKVPGKVSISGVILKFQQLNTSYGSPAQTSSELMNGQPQSFSHRASITSGPPIHDDSSYPNPPSPFSHQRYSGQGNISMYTEHFQPPNTSFSSWQPLPSSSAGPVIYQGHGSGGAPSTVSFGGTMNTNVVNENRPHHPSPQNQVFASSWSSLNPERTLASNLKVGTFVTEPSSVLISSQSEFASTQQSLTVQQQQSCTPATNSEQQFMGVPNNSSISQSDQNQQLQRPFLPTSVSIPQLQHDHLAQLATLLGQRSQSAQLPVLQPVQENQQQPSPPISQSLQNFSAVPQANLQVQATASMQSSSGQFSYGHQLQQHTSQLAALPRGGHVNDVTAAESQMVPDNQTQNDGREESEPDPQKRLQATLQLAAALLQQIQQQSRTGDQQ